MSLRDKAYLGAVAVLMSTALAVGFALVWLNIERVSAAYAIKELSALLDARTALHSKLEVERDQFLAPQRVRELAQHYDLYPAKPGQMRRTVDGPALAAPARPAKKSEPGGVRQLAQNGVRQ